MPLVPSTNYLTSPLWQSITPIPLDEGPPGPYPALACIAYSARYSTAMSYLRAVMAANEQSERALALTEDIIGMNPAHYTVWLYRAKIVRELGLDVRGELGWLEGVARRSLKNYQIWHHRQTLMSSLPTLPSTELPFLTSILALDSKNYHVWTYRQWLVSHFDLYDSPGEMAAVETLLREDVRNNSAWNHRWFLCFGRDELLYGKNQKKNPKKTTFPKGKASYPQAGMENVAVVIDEDLIDRELSFAQSQILLAPQNQSPWNYLRGLYRKAGRPLAELRDFTEQFAGEGVDVEEGVQSSHALDLLADIYAEVGEVERARRVLEVLGRRWDPIRKGYWDWRARLLEDREGEQLGKEDGEEEGEAEAEVGLDRQRVPEAEGKKEVEALPIA